MYRFILLLLILVVGVREVEGQRFTLRQYTVVDGLPQSQVNAIVEDPLGYLWIGTSGGGLARFDGREFKVYTTLDGLLSNVVSSLFIDSHQNLWVMHPRGLTKFDGLSFRKFQPEGTAARRVRRMVEYHDTVFMVSNPGLIGKIHEDSVYYWSKRILPDKSIFFTHVAPDGSICYYLSDSSFMVISEQGPLRFPHDRVFNKAYNMFNHGREVWLDTDSGTFAMDLKGGFSRRQKVVDRYIIYYDSAMDHYWTRDERTLYREYMSGELLKTDTVLMDVPIISVHVDTEGNTWLGSAGKGLYRYYATDFNRITVDPGAVTAIEKDHFNGLWVGGKSLSYIREGKKLNFPLPNGDDDGVHTIRTAPDGQVWVGSYSALGQYAPDRKKFTWYNRQDGLTSAYITSIDFDEKGGVWIGTTGGGLNYFDGVKFTAVGEAAGLTSRNVTSLCYMRSNGSLFIGTEVGLQQWKEGKIRSIELPEFENTSILSMAILRDSILLAASGGAGLAILDPSGGHSKLIGPHEGLPSGFVFFVATDETGRIWLGTEKGITRMKLDAKLEIVETRDFGFDNGLNGIETSQNAYYLSPKEKYFGLIDGLYQFLESANAGVKPYPVHLTDIQIRYGEIPVRQFGKGLMGFFKLPASLVLSSDDNHITFTFNRVDKRYPKAVRYRYFLRNFDKSWSQPSAQSRVTYSNLPAGDYVFQVLATDNEGRWDDWPIEYAFSIKAPFYQTSAFYLVMGGLLVGSLALFTLTRMRRNVSNAIAREHIRQQEQEALRKEIARDFHDEMGNQLTRIINYVSLMRLTGNGQGTDLYQKVEESAKYLYNGTRDFIWAIDPVNDDLGKLFLHVRDFGEKLFEEKNIRFRAYNDLKGKVKLPYGFSREANLIFKEAMTNAFKHSGAENVSFYLRQEGDVFEMVLQDDGKGFDPQVLSGHNGLKNIRTRAEKIQSSLVVERIPDSPGTRVVLRLNNIKIKTYDAGDQKTRSHR
ncbi:MAG: hypothetical protein JST46_11345 [Bacteroidetes bacterium]|nr:hypothetical protein [Bacteroidota bacterium]